MTGQSRVISERLAGAFSSLPPFEQRLLSLLSVIYEPTNRSTIVSCLQQAGIKGPQGDWLILPTLTPHVAALQKLGLIDEQFRCHALLCEQLIAAAAMDGSLPAMAAAIRQELPYSREYGSRTQQCWRLMRELRFGVYTNDIDLVERLLSLDNSHCPPVLGTRFPLLKVLTEPFQPKWFTGLPASSQYYFLEQVFDHGLKHLSHFAGPYRYLEQAIAGERLPEEERLPFHRMLATYQVWRGQLAETRTLMEQYPQSFLTSGLAGCLDFLAGRASEAIDSFEADLEQLRQASARQDIYFGGLAGPLFIQALLKAAQGPADLARARQYLNLARARPGSDTYTPAYNALAAVLQAQAEGHVDAEGPLMSVLSDDAVALLFASLLHYWLNGDLAEEMIAMLQSQMQRAADQGFSLIAAEFAELLARVPAAPGYAGLAGKLQPQTGLISLLDAPKLEEPWQRRLRALLALTAAASGLAPARLQKRRRLVWLIGHDGERLTISPREQFQSAVGRWSKGRPVAVERFATGRPPTCLTDQDRRIIQAALTRRPGPPAAEYFLDPALAAPALVGHPLLFLEESPTVPVEFVRGDPEVLVEERDGHLLISFLNDISLSGPTVIRESRSRFRLIELTDKYRRIARIIGPGGLAVPLTARAEVEAAIASLSSLMTVHAAISGRPSTLTEVAADSTIHVQLLPLGNGFRVEMLVRPFASGGPYLKPGKGVKTVIAEVEGQRLQTRRDLAREQQQAQAVLAACPALAAESSPSLIWYLPAAEDCLQVLLELQGLRDQVIVEWPEGERLTVSRHASFRQLRLRIRQMGSWFEVSGGLQVDESLVLDLKELLQQAQTGTKRFVALGAGQFLALTKKLHNRLQELALLCEKAPAGEQGGAPLRLHPLAALALEDFMAQFESLDADEGWLSLQARIKAAQELVPEVPAGLTGQLREYQQQGYIWLARLAYLGFGAILADDMGLGKTMQALAILLARASGGPALVVAPTSVVMNWQEEARRFAPTLALFTLEAKGRRQLIDRLGPGDALITSYTLLQQEAELLAAKSWETIVLDEAQAIKNMATKRSRAAMSLTGRFKLLTTGTPIENHLGELWNLFDFIIPGLLGPLEQFNRRFAMPIEREHSREAGDNLKKLIHPFILRRTKSQVLAELPARTEIILHVEMDEPEAAFYEALRREALENLRDLQERSLAGNGRGPLAGQTMRVLAEIMRLRQACCNPRLVAPQSAVPSAKLGLFMKVVAELKENQHQVLVFSQFVGHLAIIREALDAAAISYRYLDGSTPVRRRQQEITAFQAGKADLFLISLKAGGLGLNLTAADYVIHMDPWWNPAVEDQASDRAHRLGQTRPVTIYRLVTRNTIEEKIVQLHQEKRDLASSLLAGTDVSGAISAAELLNLIRGN